MNVDDIINCVKFHVGDYDKPYFEILGNGINLTPWGFITYAMVFKIPLREEYPDSVGLARYEYHALISAQKTHPHIVKQYFEDAPEVRLEWETVDSIIKLLRR